MPRKKRAARIPRAPAAPATPQPAVLYDPSVTEAWGSAASAISICNWVASATKGDLADAIAQAELEYQRWQVVLSNDCAQCKEGYQYRTWPSDVVRAEDDLARAHARLWCLTRYRDELGTRPPLAPLHLPVRRVFLRDTLALAYDYEVGQQKLSFFPRLARKFGESQVIASPLTVSGDVSIVLPYCRDIIAGAAEIDAAFEAVARQLFPGQAPLSPDFLPVARCLYDIAASWSSQLPPPGDTERSIRGLTRYGEQAERAIRQSPIADPPKELGTLKGAALAVLRASPDKWFTPNMVDGELKRRPARSGRMRAVLHALLAEGLAERRAVLGTRGVEYRAVR